MDPVRPPDPSEGPEVLASWLTDHPLHVIAKNGALTGFYLPSKYDLAQYYNDRDIAYRFNSGGQLQVYEHPVGRDGVMTAVQYADDDTPPNLQAPDVKPVTADLDAFGAALDYLATVPRGAALVQQALKNQLAWIPIKDTNDRFQSGPIYGPPPGDSMPDDISTWSVLGSPNGQNTVYWNPKAALGAQARDTDQIMGNISPALSLGHEMDHGVGYDISPVGFYNLQHQQATDGFDNLEERRVMQGLSIGQALRAFGSKTLPPGVAGLLGYSTGNGFESAIARALREPVRVKHEFNIDDGDGVKWVSSPTAH